MVERALTVSSLIRVLVLLATQEHNVRQTSTNVPVRHVRMVERALML
jgi:hypothetical protein